MIRNGSQRHWSVHLLAMVLALSLVTGFAVTAGLRVRRKEQDGMNDWRVEPLSIAHRGDDSAPENSLHAIANAGAAGADFAEIDVRLASDGTPVVFHDRKTGRLAADGRNVPVNALPAHELMHMTMRQYDENFHVPTLAEAILTAQRASDHMGLLIDLKTGSRHALQLTRAVAKQISRYRFTDRVMFMSTNDDAIRAIQRHHPYWTVGKCISPAGRPAIEWPRGVSFVVMRGNRVDRSVIRHAKRDDVPVYAGVDGDYIRAKECLKLGADGILGASARRVRKLAERFAVNVPADSNGNFDEMPAWKEQPFWHMW